MEISRIINNIKSMPAYAKTSATLNSAATSMGIKYEKSAIKNIYEKFLEPKGANNTFPVIAGIMIFLGVMPRFFAAAKRNPDDKEATKDEIKEIAFRDVQTVAILLFLLKALQATIAGAATKKTGLPMTNKPFEKLFSSSSDTLKAKAQELLTHPIEKLKIAGRNIKDAINPMGGVITKTNTEHIADYSKYDFDSLPKLLKKIEDERGNKEKIFNTIIDGTIQKYKTTLNGNKQKGIYGITDRLKASVDKENKPIEDLEGIKNNIEMTIKKLEELKEKGIEGLEEIKTSEDEAVKTAISHYLSDENNSMLKKAKGLNAWLRTSALAMEISYLGFGIPALNQKRLEKKYLKNGIQDSFDCDKSGSLILKNIKAHQIKLYHNFIK